MFHRGIAVLALLVHTPAFAGLIPGTFAGNDDGTDGLSLTGSFLLDADAPWTITSFGSARDGTLVSPRQTISGTYGGYEFSGAARLVAVDAPPEIPGWSMTAFEHWIVRATVSSTMLGDVWMTALNFGAVEISTDYDYLTPYAPPISGFVACAVEPCSQTFWMTPEYWYTAAFSDGSTRSGRLTMLSQPASVPEPGTLLLLSSALGLALLRKKRRA